MRINLPNIAYALRHPVRAARYVLHRDKIAYDVVARYLPADPVIVEAGAHDGTSTVGRAGDVQHARAHGRSEIGQDLIGVEIEASVHLPAVSARGTPAGLAGLQHDGIDPEFRQMEGS